MRSRKRILRALRFRALSFLFQPLARGPVAVSRWFARRFGDLAWCMLRRHRARAEAHLAAAFPERDLAWRRGVTRQVFRWIAGAGVSFLRLDRIDLAATVRGLEVEGEEHWRAAVASGRGIVLVTGHFGNWELLGGVLAYWLATSPRPECRMHVLYRTVEPPGLDRAIGELRRAVGVVPLPVEQGLGPAVRALRRGNVVGLLIDRVPRGTAVSGRFFGVRCRQAAGAARLALAGDAWLLPAALWTDADGRYRVRFLRPELAERDGERHDAVVRATRRMNEALERMIRSAPEQWPWFENRWKDRPGETWGDASPGEAGDGADSRPGPDRVHAGDSAARPPADRHR
ncbi:MAG: lysophospholipid acyltransferase family protein [Candidatus Eisenbacteria bacterium]|nr:lysophospholipid acyltransferase family protein [Candidatus Eisenbacteria bacterium]